MGFNSAFKVLIQEKSSREFILLWKLTLNNFGRDSHNCISHTYYGVVLADKQCPSNYLCTLHMYTTYVHYINHLLDLEAFHVRKSIKSARNFLLLLNGQCVFWIGSAWQAFNIRISALLYTHQTLLEHLDGIWWSCQKTCLSAVKKTYPGTLVTSAPFPMSNKR